LQLKIQAILKSKSFVSCQNCSGFYTKKYNQKIFLQPEFISTFISDSLGEKLKIKKVVDTNGI